MKTIAFSGEDEISEAVARKCVCAALPEFEFLSWRPRQGGASGVLTNLHSYCKSSHAIPIFVLLDLDEKPCPPRFRAETLAKIKIADFPPKLLFCIAVREVESWILADSFQLADFFGVNSKLLTNYPDDLEDPKLYLTRIAEKSVKYSSQICPTPGTSAKVGPGYNAVLGDFVSQRWRTEVARQNSPSLDRTLNRLANLGEIPCLPCT